MGKKLFRKRMKGLISLLLALIMLSGNSAIAMAEGSGSYDYEYKVMFKPGSGSSLNATGLDLKNNLQIIAGDKIISAAKLNVTDDIFPYVGQFPDGDYYLLQGGSTIRVTNGTAHNSDSGLYYYLKVNSSEMALYLQSDSSDDTDNYIDIVVGESGHLYTWYPSGLESYSGHIYKQNLNKDVDASSGDYYFYNDTLNFVEVYEIDYPEGAISLDIGSGGFHAPSVKEDGHTYFPVSSVFENRPEKFGGSNKPLYEPTCAEGEAFTVVTLDAEDGIMLYSRDRFYLTDDLKAGLKIRLVHKDTHTVTPVAANGATCTAAGNKAYFYCENCKEYFSDSDCKNEIDIASMNLNAIGHNVKKIEAVAATCSATGNKEYYYCSNCKKYFEDEACTKETTLAELTIAEDESNHSDVVEDAAVAAKCTTAGKTKGSHCTACNKVIIAQTVVAAKGHTAEDPVITPATTKKDGSIVKKCSVCGEVIDTAIIGKAFIAVEETAKYTGKAVKQPVKITDVNGKAISKSFYTLAYKNNIKEGKASVTIKFTGNYSGTVTKNFTIVKKNIIPGKVTGLKLTGASKAIKVSWKKGGAKVDGYEFQYSTDKKFLSGVKTVKVTKADTISKDVKKLKAKTTYYVRIRAYNKEGKTTAYSAWSTAKSVKTK